MAAQSCAGSSVARNTPRRTSTRAPLTATAPDCIVVAAIYTDPKSNGRSAAGTENADSADEVLSAIDGFVCGRAMSSCRCLDDRH